MNDFRYFFEDFGVFLGVFGVKECLGYSYCKFCGKIVVLNKRLVKEVDYMHNNMLANNNEIEISVRTVDQDDSYSPMMYENLPAELQSEINDIAAELIDPDRGHLAITGTAQSGKTLLLHNAVGNMHRYTDRLNRDPLVFVRLGEDEMNVISTLKNSYNTYRTALMKELNVKNESDLVFVVENPVIASRLFNYSKTARIILEVNRATFMQMVRQENSGDTKIWSSWEFIDLTDILLKKNDLINFVYETIHEKMKEVYNVTITKKMVTLFVSHVVNQIPGIMGTEGELRNRLFVPVGIWLLAIRRMAGILGLSETSAYHNKSGNLVISRLISRVFDDNARVFDEFAAIDDEEDMLGINVEHSNGDRYRIPVPKEFLNLMRDSVTEEDVENDGEPEDSRLVFNDLETIDTVLHENVMGQDSALEKIVEGLTIPAAKLNDTRKPIRSMLFLGPTGVGKTETALTLAKCVARDEEMNVVRIDMSEYSQAHEVAKLLGAPPGYAGFEKGGILTSAIAKNPKSIVLLDEVEKAHPKIWDSFLQILDAGRMTDGVGKQVDFTQTIVIMTSNIGSSDLQSKGVGFSALSEEQAYAKRVSDSSNIVMEAIEKEFRPELINRIDEIISFNEISKDTARKIAAKEIGILVDRMSSNGFSLDTVSDDIINVIISESNISKYGAREIQRVILRNISNPVAHEILKVKDDSLTVLRLTLNDDKKISVQSAAEEL